MSNRPQGHDGERARGGRGAGSGRSAEDIKMSKKLSRLLRHRPPDCVDNSGWVPIEVVRTTLGSIQDTAKILQVVESDEKGRFQARTLLCTSAGLLSVS